MHKSCLFKSTKCVNSFFLCRQISSNFSYFVFNINKLKIHLLTTWWGTARGGIGGRFNNWYVLVCSFAWWIDEDFTFFCIDDQFINMDSPIWAEEFRFVQPITSRLQIKLGKYLTWNEATKMRRSEHGQFTARVQWEYCLVYNTEISV